MPEFRRGVKPVHNIQGNGQIPGVKLFAPSPPPKQLDKIPLPGEGLPRYVHFNADQSGCGFWRMIWPSEQLLIHNKAVVSTNYQMVLHPLYYRGVNAVRLQRQCTEHQYEFAKELKKISNFLKEKTGQGFKLIWEVDDVVCPVDGIPEYNKCKEAFTNPQIEDTVKRIVHLCDEMTVVSPRMAKHYRECLSYDNITVLPNYFPKNWVANLYNPAKSVERFSKRKKPVVGYAGSMTHFDIANKTGQKDDFGHVVHDIIKKINDYDWVFFGGYPMLLTPYIRSGQIKHVPWGNLDRYPQILASLGLDVMIAPLQSNSFSDSKSSIKFLEGSAIGVPVICQDLPPYEISPWRFNTAQEMFDLIDLICYDDVTYKTAVETAYSFIEDYWLDDHLDEYLLIYGTEYGDPKRKENASYVKNNQFQFEKPEVPVYSI